MQLTRNKLHLIFQMSNAKEFHCGVCDITCTGKAPFEQHLASAKHLKKAKTNGNESSRASPTTPLSPSESVSLSIPSSPSTTLSAETMKILLEWNHPRGYLPFCDICQLPLHGGNNADTHFAETNQIHQQKLNNLQQIKENDPEYFCKMCAEIFPEEKSVIIHLNSESHAETKQRKASLEKFIKTYKTFQELKKARGNDRYYDLSSFDLC